MPGLADRIEKEVELPLDLLNSLKKLSLSVEINNTCQDSLRNFDHLGGVAIGLALRGVPPSMITINLLTTTK